MGSGESSTAELIEPGHRSRPRPRRRQALEREALELQRTLRTFDELMELAGSEDRVDQAAKLEELAWDHVRRAEPIRVLHATQLLGVSEPTVNSWSERGVLEARPSRPRRVTLESVLRAKHAVDELRELGRDQDLVNAVLNKLEAAELAQNDRLRKSLEQMRQGERGEWPERWADKL